MENNIGKNNLYLKKLADNIRLSYLYHFFMFFRVTNAIWVIYLGFKGMSLVEIGLLESIFHIVSFTLEIPTGALADLYGRKFSVILGRICCIISTVLMIISHSFWGFAIAFAFSALSFTLNSGSAESMVYDSIDILGRAEEYKKISGIINFIIEIGQAAAVILGGWLSDMRFVYAYLASLVIEVVALGLAFTFTEPQITGHHEERLSFYAQVRDSIAVLRERQLAFYIMLFFAVINTVGANVYFYSQKYFSAMDFSNKLVAVVFTASGIVQALGAKYAYRIEKRLSQRGVLLLLPVLNILALLGLSLTKNIWAVGFFLLDSVIQGFSYPVASDYINSMIPSEYRATILSMQSTLYSICMIGIFPLIGFLGERLGLGRAFMLGTVLFVPVFIFIALRLGKYKSLQ